MASGFKDFTAGAVLAAADLEDYCELQGIMRFASAAARTTALSGVLTEGLWCYLIDENALQVYSGSAWSTVGPVHGALTSWTPVITQSNTPTFTNNRSVYQRIGRTVFFQTKMTLTASGTSTNAVTVSLPVTAATSAIIISGNGMIYDSSATLNYIGAPYLLSTTTVQLQPVGSTAVAALGAGVFTAALATGDIIYISGTYEAAGDA